MATGLLHSGIDFVLRYQSPKMNTGFHLILVIETAVIE